VCKYSPEKSENLEGLLSYKKLFNPEVDQLKEPKTRLGRLAEKIAKAVEDLIVRYNGAATVPNQRIFMAQIVKAYNAYQVGQLLNSLINKRDIKHPQERFIPILQLWANSLLELNMDTRLKSWDTIASKLINPKQTGSSEAFAGPPRKSRRAAKKG